MEIAQLRTHVMYSAVRLVTSCLLSRNAGLTGTVLQLTPVLRTPL